MNELREGGYTMNENNMSVTIPLGVYNELIRTQATVDILRRECNTMASYEFAGFASRLLGADDAGEAE